MNIPKVQRELLQVGRELHTWGLKQYADPGYSKKGQKFRELVMLAVGIGGGSLPDLAKRLQRVK